MTLRVSCSVGVLGVMLQLMASTSVVVAEPPVLLAHTVWVELVVTPVGSPHTLPFPVPNDSPVGKDGETAHCVGVPPLTVGVTVVSGRSLTISIGVAYDTLAI